MKGIVLAGGSGTRLAPLTTSVCKQLMPVFDKPMIYYPISVLMLAGIKDILIITTPEDLRLFENLLGDGSLLGVRFSYAIQDRPAGIAQAFLIGEDFIAGDSVCLILGDNIFYGDSLAETILSAGKHIGATIFGYYVNNPEEYGVVDFDDDGRVVSLEEKPDVPKSHYVVPGLYFYDENVCNYAADIIPSSRGELEITDLNKIYLEKGDLHVEILGRGIAWLDTGSHSSLLDAGLFVKTIEERQGLKIACLEEIAYRQGIINEDVLKQSALKYNKSGYGTYLLELIERGVGRG